MPTVGQTKKKLLSRRRDTVCLCMSQTRRPRIETLAKRIRDDDPATRRLAIQKAKKLGTPEAVDLLILALEDPDDGVRGDAISALESVRAPAAVTPLLRVLRTSGSSTRDVALTALAKIGSPVPTAVLLPFILDDRIDLRTSLFLDVLCPGWQRTEEATAMVPVAIQALASSPQRSLCGAIRFLGRVRASEAVPVLRSCLHRYSSYVHQLAMEALALIENPELLPKPSERYLKQDEIDTWWKMVEESGWLTESPPSELERILTSLREYIGHPEYTCVVLAPTCMHTETIYKSGDYRRWVIPHYRAASFESFIPRDVDDRVDTRKGVADLSFRVGNTVFSRQFRQEGVRVADGLLQFMNEVMHDLDHRKRFYALPWVSRGALPIVCITPSIYERACHIGLIPRHPSTEHRAGHPE
jgi:hypothetical protein